MSMVVDEIRSKMQALQQDLEQEFEVRRTHFKYTLNRRKVLFQKDVIAHHRALRKGVLRFWRESGALNFITSPVIYALVIPLAVLDFSLSIFQWVCFPIYGIKRVPRSDFIAIDRHHLAYLNWVEKLNCAYCGYGNGVIAYGREIASRTEQRWCPIKHARRVSGVHDRYYAFDDFGDAESFRKRTNGKAENHPS